MQARAEPRGGVVRRQLINVVHHNMSRYHQDWFKRGECVLVTEKVTFADGTREKRVLKMERPTVRYHVTGEGHRDGQRNQEAFVPLAICDEYESEVGLLDRHAAELTGQMDFFNETRGPGQNMRRRKIHEHRWLHGSDANLCDHYIDRYMEQFRDQLDVDSPLDFAAADIEVDAVDCRGFPDEFEAAWPVSLISYFSRGKRRVTQWLLRNGVRGNPLVAEAEANQERLRRRVLAEANRAPLARAGLLRSEEAPWEAVDALLRSSEEARSKMRCLESELRFFDGEAELILDFLRHVNEVDRPDVLGWWNQCFDVNTLLGRLRRLRVDPALAFTSSDAMPWAYADYRRDEFNTQPTDRGDTFLAACSTIYVDLMLLYASLRKQEIKKESYSLEFTLGEELGERKLGYDGSIRDLAYRDYERFVAYGAVDVVPLATLEDRTEDAALAYRISMLTRTRFHKVMKKTVCLRNLAAVFLREQGYAISNNHNRNAERVAGEKFVGGFVVDPMLMEHAGALVGGVRSNRVFESTVDLDAKALYPSLILMCNIDPSTQIGRLLLQGADGEDLESSDFVASVAGGDPVELGRRWFGLPGLGELAGSILGLPGMDAPAAGPPGPPEEAWGPEEQEEAEEEPDQGERDGDDPEAGGA